MLMSRQLEMAVPLERLQEEMVEAQPKELMAQVVVVEAALERQHQETMEQVHLLVPQLLAVEQEEHKELRELVGQQVQHPALKARCIGQ